jgi:hypothetical protein
VCSEDNLKSFLHKFCYQDGGSAGVSRPGGQGKGEVARRAKLQEQEQLGQDPNQATFMEKGLSSETHGEKNSSSQEALATFPGGVPTGA